MTGPADAESAILIFEFFFGEAPVLSPKRGIVILIFDFFFGGGRDRYNPSFFQPPARPAEENFGG